MQKSSLNFSSYDLVIFCNNLIGSFLSNLVISIGIEHEMMTINLLVSGNLLATVSVSEESFDINDISSYNLMHIGINKNTTPFPGAASSIYSGGPSQTLNRLPDGATLSWTRL
jgi:hypothetical protein